MAKLRISAESHPRPIPARCVIGRAPSCELQLSDDRISSEHALLSWRGGTWELQDLYSRNGTFVDERALAGTVIGLGRSAEQCTLTDAGPPIAFAIAVEPPHIVVEVQSKFIALPDSDEPELTNIERDEGWWLERDDGLERLVDGAILSTRAGAWRLHLPESVPPTRDAEDSILTLTSLTVTFVVDPQGKPKLIRLSRGGQRRVELESRAHHAVLLALARVRLAERERPAAEQGWIASDALLASLGYDVNRLNVEIHRARRQFADVGVIDAAALVERRRENRALRLSVGNLEIVELTAT